MRQIKAALEKIGFKPPRVAKKKKRPLDPLEAEDGDEGDDSLERHWEMETWPGNYL